MRRTFGDKRITAVTLILLGASGALSAPRDVTEGAAPPRAVAPKPVAEVKAPEPQAPEVKAPAPEAGKQIPWIHTMEASVTPGVAVSPVELPSLTAFANAGFVTWAGWAVAALLAFILFGKSLRYKRRKSYIYRADRATFCLPPTTTIRRKYR